MSQSADALLSLIGPEPLEPQAAPQAVVVAPCQHSAHAANVAVHRIITNGAESWAVEVSVKCALCDSLMLFNGQQAARLEAKHER